MKSKQPGSRLTSRRGRLAALKSVAGGTPTAGNRRQGAHPELDDGLSDEIDEQELDWLMNPAVASTSSTRRLIEQYREDQALRKVLEDSFFDYTDRDVPGGELPNRGA